MWNGKVLKTHMKHEHGEGNEVKQDNFHTLGWNQRVCDLFVMFHIHRKMRLLAVSVCAMCAMERYMKMHMKNEHGDGHWAESW